MKAKYIWSVKPVHQVVPPFPHHYPFIFIVFLAPSSSNAGLLWSRLLTPSPFLLFHFSMEWEEEDETWSELSWQSLKRFSLQVGIFLFLFLKKKLVTVHVSSHPHCYTSPFDFFGSLSESFITAGKSWNGLKWGKRADVWACWEEYKEPDVLWWCYGKYVLIIYPPHEPS